MAKTKTEDERREATIRLRDRYRKTENDAAARIRTINQEKGQAFKAIQAEAAKFGYSAKDWKALMVMSKHLDNARGTLEKVRAFDDDAVFAKFSAGVQRLGKDDLAVLPLFAAADAKEMKAKAKHAHDDEAEEDASVTRSPRSSSRTKANGTAVKSDDDASTMVNPETAAMSSDSLEGATTH